MGHEHHGGVEPFEVALEPLERGDVEVVGGFVEEQEVGVARERAGERGAGELSAREGVEAPVQSVVGEAQTVQRPERARPPVPAAGVLEPGLCLGVAVEERGVVGPRAHRGLELGQRLLERHEVAAAGEDVVAQREAPLARRALVVQGQPSALLEHELAAIHGRLAGEHPEQRGLAGPVAARQGHPITALELEGDVAEQRRAAHVLVQR